MQNLQTPDNQQNAFLLLRKFSKKIAEGEKEKETLFFSKLHSILEEEIFAKNEFFRRLIENRDNSKTNQISRIFHLLSKKYKQKVDENFINEQIKYYILKEKIKNQNLIDFVNNTQAIKVDKGEFEKDNKINKMEKRIKLYLAIELFYPLDLTFHKYQQLYHRNFFRNVRLFIAQKEYDENVNKFKRAFGNLEDKFYFLKKSSFSLIKTKKDKEFNLLFNILTLLIKKKVKDHKNVFLRNIMLKDKNRWLAYLVDQKQQKHKRTGFYEILKKSLFLSKDKSEETISYNKEIIGNNTINNNSNLFKQSPRRVSTVSDVSNHRKFIKMETFGIHNQTEKKKKTYFKYKNFFSFLHRIQNTKNLQAALDSLKTYQNSIDIVETIRTPQMNFSKTKKSKSRNKTSIQSITNTYKGKKKETIKNKQFVKKQLKETGGFKQKKENKEDSQTSLPTFEVIGVEDKTFMLEPKTIQNDAFAGTTMISRNELSYQIPLVNDSTTFTQAEQVKRYRNVLQTSLKRIATVSDLGSKKKFGALSQCPSKKLFDIDGSKKIDLYGSYMQNSSQNYLRMNKNTKSVSSLFIGQKRKGR